MVPYTYDPTLVVASVFVSFMAAFTGLTLTNGISRLSPNRRKLLVVMAAFVLGGGIWSMHFVAMLAVQLPLVIFYDSLLTLGSALIAILLAGVSLLILHFAPRGRLNIIVSGLVLGSGIIAMHYVGMSGLRGCLTVYEPLGIGLSVLFAGAMGIAAIWTAYGRRTRQNILVGTIVFGLSVVIVHFTAMNSTMFVTLENPARIMPTMENGSLAILVTLSAFVICGTFLLSSVSFFGAENFQTELADAANPAAMPVPSAMPRAGHPAQAALAANVRIPYEREKRTLFIPSNEVAAIRAEGHYTFLYARTAKLFCPWSISEAEERLAGCFQRTHRSYLVNIEHVSGFEKRKDNGACMFDEFPQLKNVPVSRSRIKPLREALGF